MIEKGLFLLAGFLAFGTAQTPQARAAAGSGLELRNGVCQLYTGDSLTPAARIRVNAVHRDYETRGFFRLGVLPLEVADGVVIEIYDSASVAKCLSQCESVLFGRGAGRTEVRQLEVRVAGPTTNRLTCARVRLASAEQWELLGTVSVESGSGCIVAERGRLRVAGRRAGEIILESTPPRSFWLCEPELIHGGGGHFKTKRREVPCKQPCR